MIVQLTVRDHNKQIYKDLVNDMRRKYKDVFTFVIRVNAGNIVDYVKYENVTFKNR